MKTQDWSRINGMRASEKYGKPIEPDVVKAAGSPDGTQVAYLKGNELGLWAVSSMSKKILLNRHFSTRGSGIAWSQDGKTLAFCADQDGECRLYTYDLAAHKTTEHRM